MTIICLWLLLGLYLAFKMAERSSMIAALPLEVEINGVEWIAGQSGFREGCGAAVFRLSTAMRQRLQDQGIQALGDALQGRGHGDDHYYQYAAWLPTPGDDLVGGEGWMALSCADLPKALNKRIYQGLGSPGGYITTKDEAVLLVLPSEGLVVFGYNG